MKVLVTGASGFIGGHVIDRLLSEGHQVIAFDRHQKLACDRPYPSGVDIFLGDVIDEVQVTEAMAHAEGFIHLAACLGTQETILNPRPAAITNVVGGLNILEAADQYNVPGVYICVGNHWMNNTYSITKTTVERFVRMFVKERGTRVNNLRCVNAYGARQVAAAPFGPGKVRKIMPSFICRALSGMPIEVYGDGTQVSDMVHVSDVASGLVSALLLADSGTVVERAIEVGPRTSTTVNGVAELVREAAFEYTEQHVDITHLPMRPGEIPNAVVSADVSTLEDVGISPDEFVPIEDGIRSTVAWFAAHKGTHWHVP